MKLLNYLSLVSLVVFTGTAWAYGGGGGSSSKACDKPKFTDFKPAANAEVAAGSDFSFTASKNTYPSTIKVSVKDRAVDTASSARADGSIIVSGKIPTSIKGNYARISITADAQSNCKGTGGWLVKIKE